MNVLVYVIVSRAALEDLVKLVKVYDAIHYDIVNLILFYILLSFSNIIKLVIQYRMQRSSIQRTMYEN